MLLARHGATRIRTFFRARPFTSKSTMASPFPRASALEAYEGPRALASVVRIDSLTPIDGADKIVAAKIKGWTCVVAKADGYVAGQLAAYFEIDSLLPAVVVAEGVCGESSPGNPFAFLKDAGCFARVEGVGEGYRIKTRKLRGVVSQGLVMPLSAFGWSSETMLATGTGASGSVPQRVSEGLDITAVLGVKKYEMLNAFPPSSIKGAWPPFLKKTDQERVQNVWADLLERRKENAEEVFEVTLKLDGTSCTAFHYNGSAGVCSRNLQVHDGAAGGVYALLGDPIAAALAKRGLNLAIQGEILGPKIGGNRERFLMPRLFVFDVWDIDAQEYWDDARRRTLCADLGLEHVPVIEHTTLGKFSDVGAVLAYAERPSVVHKVAEGVVFKSREDPGFGFKAVAQSYLLKEA